MPTRPQSTRRIVVALDGPASSGKSSVGAAAAEQLQLRFVDTGLFYRALTALALLEDVPLEDPAALVPLVDRVSLGDDGSGRFTRVLLDGVDATDEARSAMVDGSVSTVARIPEVRTALLERQRSLAAEGGIVMAGRDVGTVVLPDADLKLYLDASVEERARRRIEERGLDPHGAEADEVREQLRARDAIDSGREVAPLRAADDAVHVTTDGNAFGETVEIVAAEIASVMMTPRPRAKPAPKAKEGIEPAEAAEAAEVADAIEVVAAVAAADAVEPAPQEEPAPAPKRTRATKPKTEGTTATRTRTSRAKAATVAVAATPRTRSSRAKVTPDADPPMPAKRTRSTKAAAASEDAPKPKPTRTRTPKPKATAVTEPAIEEAVVIEPIVETPPVVAATSNAPTHRSQKRARAAARRAEAHEAPPAAADDVPDPTAAPPAAPAHSPTHRSQKRARATARRAATAGAVAADTAAEPATVAPASVKSEPTHRSQKRARATARRAEARNAAVDDAPVDEETTPEVAPRTTSSEPTHRSQKRARATARRAAAASSAVEEPAITADVAETASTSSVATHRSQKRARATARRTALAAAELATPDEPQVEEAQPARAATSTRRSEKRARATARRAAAVAVVADEGLASHPQDEVSVAGHEISHPQDDGQPEAAATDPEERTDSHSQAEPEPRVAEPSHSEGDGAVAPPAPTPPRAPRPAAPPKPRDPILDAAMNLDNDKTMLVRMTALVARIGARMFADVDVQGLDNIPRRGAVILAANHISNFDGVVVGAWITDALKRRRIHWLGKREMFEWPVVGWLAANGGVHPVDRDSADIEAFRLATKILEEGYVLLVFPEGTRSPTGELQEAKDGVAMLALRTGAQIVPIGVSNTDAVWKKGTKLPSPFPRQKVTVRIGLPFRVEDSIPEGTSRREAKTIATTEIMGRIAALLDPRHRGVYASAVRGTDTRNP